MISDRTGRRQYDIDGVNHNRKTSDILSHDIIPPLARKVPFKAALQGGSSVGIENVRDGILNKVRRDVDRGRCRWSEIGYKIVDNTIK